MFKTIKTAAEVAADEAAAAAEQRIAELRRLLAESDYVALADYDKPKPELIAERAAWRAELRSLKEVSSDA
jgi:hypothetical protein